MHLDVKEKLFVLLISYCQLWALSLTYLILCIVVVWNIVNGHYLSLSPYQFNLPLSVTNGLIIAMFTFIWLFYNYNVLCWQQMKKNLARIADLCKLVYKKNSIISFALQGYISSAPNKKMFILCEFSGKIKQDKNVSVSCKQERVSYNQLWRSCALLHITQIVYL